MRFVFDGGDGDQRYLGDPFIAERVFEPWFPKQIYDGEAYLALILTGAHKDEYLALTSRMVASLEEQLRVRDYLSVVVHLVRNPGPDFTADAGNLPAIGMAAVKVVTPPNPLISAHPW
jgi:hypothetical protein